MKKSFNIFAIATMAASIALAATGCGGGGNQGGGGTTPEPPKENWEITSPDATLKINAGLDSDGKLYYGVIKDETTVVETSYLGFTIEEEDFGFLTVENVDERTVLLSYDNITGKNSTVEDYCNETTISLKAWKYYLDLTFRAYDDGYAFRYGIRTVSGDEGEINVVSEDTQFALPENSTVWSENYVSNKPANGEFFSYEEAYTRKKSSSLANKYVPMPLLYNVKGSDVYSLITESGLIGSGFYGSYLREAEENSGKGILQTVHSPARKADPDNVISVPFTSPWRLGITGSLKSVCESDLVEKLYDDVEPWKPDNYNSLTAEEKEIYNYEWVDASASSWNWLLGGHNAASYDYVSQRKYIDLSAEMGWGYVLLDAAWEYNHRPDEIIELVDYAHEKGVKVVIWCSALNDFGNGKKTLLTAKLDMWSSYKIDGIKIDFFDGQSSTGHTFQGEDKEMIDWYETIYQETAKRKMIVNCHGSNKPTGERRIYPNVINREGIRGNEFNGVDSSITVNSMFTRNVIGPCDFTPVVKPLSTGLTTAHQMALAVLYESGSPTMADRAETYLGNELFKEFYSHIPALHDETLFLCGELDGYYVGAVRVGQDWFVAGINSVMENKVSIDFSFLGQGNYNAYIYTDNADSVTKTQKTLNASSTEELIMSASGGFVIRLCKK